MIQKTRKRKSIEEYQYQSLRDVIKVGGDDVVKRFGTNSGRLRWKDYARNLWRLCLQEQRGEQEEIIKVDKVLEDKINGDLLQDAPPLEEIGRDLQDKTLKVVIEIDLSLLLEEGLTQEGEEMILGTSPNASDAVARIVKP